MQKNPLGKFSTQKIIQNPPVYRRHNEENASEVNHISIQ